MKLYKVILAILLTSLMLSACIPATATATASPTIPPTVSVTPASAAPTDANAAPVYKDASAPVESRVQDLLARMTLAEKLGQMTQIEKGSLKPEDVTRLYIGSILSGGGGSPRPNDAQSWLKMTTAFQDAALKTPLAIPIIYGVDAVHGHNNLYGAVIYPQEIGLGAANDPDLVKRIGRATAEEMLATGAQWNFAPVLAVPQDIRWGRTYEAYGENTDLVTRLGTADIQGLQGEKLSDPTSVLATPKHFLGDGATTFGTSTNSQYLLDQGDVRIDEDTMRSMYLPPYKAAVDAGALSVMASFSSWNGVKMHAQKYLLTDVLKGELKFKGFVVSDWGGIDQVSPDYYKAVVSAINAGVDMNMVPYDANKFIQALSKAVNNKDVPMARIDDAVSRILYVKFAMGLFEHPYGDKNLLDRVGSDEHRQLAREAAAKSAVLLQNNRQALPLDRKAKTIFVAGKGADDIGMQCGGWTIEWQGAFGNIIPGTSILQAIKQKTSENQVVYDAAAGFTKPGTPAMADIGIAVIGEKPYAEGVGDARNLSLSTTDQEVIKKLRAKSRKLVVVILSGRPLIITDLLSQADAWVAAWLPGSEGTGVADVLFGDQPFSGKLSYTWPRGYDQIPIHTTQAGTTDKDALFPYGFGLTTQ